MSQINSADGADSGRRAHGPAQDCVPDKAVLGALVRRRQPQNIGYIAFVRVSSPF